MCQRSFLLIDKDRVNIHTFQAILILPSKFPKLSKFHKVDEFRPESTNSSRLGSAITYPITKRLCFGKPSRCGLILFLCRRQRAAVKTSRIFVFVICPIIAVGKNRGLFFVVICSIILVLDRGSPGGIKGITARPSCY